MAGDHKCPVCQATFTRPQHVARHMRSHTGDRPYKCQHCGDQFARSDLLSRHINKCHASERPPTTTAPNQRRKGNAAASRATTSKQACDQCVQSTLPCDGANPCSKCVQRKYRCTYVKFHRQTAPSGPGHLPPPRVDADLGMGASLYAPTVTNGNRYAGPQDEFAYSPLTSQAPPAAAAALYQSPYTFNPALGSYSQHQGAAADTTHGGDPLDFAARYRHQAEMLRRAGVIPPPAVQDVNALQPGVGVPPYASTYANGVWAEDASRKESEQFDQYAYLDPTRQHYLRQQPSAPAPPYAQDIHANGAYYGHARTGSWEEHHPRRSSFAESDGTSSVDASSISSAASSTSNNLPLDLATHPRGGYAPPSLPATTTENSSRPSTASGIGLATPTPAKDRETRDRFGSLFSLSGAPLPTRDSKEGSKDDASLADLTPREAETRELREFWKAYMRTPLSGGGPLGGPTPTAAGTMLGVSATGDSSRPGLAGKRGLSRVSSMPSVKTPAREHAQYMPGAMMPPAQRAPSASTTAADDLRSYEAAVLSRRAPMNLNLIPKRARAGSMILGGAYDDNRGSSASPPSQNAAAVPARPNTANTYHPTAYTYDPSARGSSATTSTDEDNSSDPERTNGRPSFKRLASQTLGPEQAKRPMYAHDGRIPDGSALETDDGSTSDKERRQIPRTLANVSPERQRRMSAPSGGLQLPPPQGLFAEAGYA